MSAASRIVEDYVAALLDDDSLDDFEPVDTAEVSVPVPAPAFKAPVRVASGPTGSTAADGAPDEAASDASGPDAATHIGAQADAAVPADVGAREILDPSDEDDIVELPLPDVDEGDAMQEDAGTLRLLCAEHAPVGVSVRRAQIDRMLAELPEIRTLDDVPAWCIGRVSLAGTEALVVDPFVLLGGTAPPAACWLLAGNGRVVLALPSLPSTLDLDPSAVVWRGEGGHRPWLEGVASAARCALLDLDGIEVMTAPLLDSCRGDAE